MNRPKKPQFLSPPARGVPKEQPAQPGPSGNFPSWGGWCPSPTPFLLRALPLSGSIRVGPYSLFQGLWSEGTRDH